MAISALYWTAFVRSKGLAPEDTAYIGFPVDLRKRLSPPVSGHYYQYYLGNCVTKCLASAGAGELVGARGLVHASRAIQAALREVAAAPLGGTEVPWPERVRPVPAGRLTSVAGYTLLPAYEAADFGFGRPAFVDHARAGGPRRKADAECWQAARRGAGHGVAGQDVYGRVRGAYPQHSGKLQGKALIDSIGLRSDYPMPWLFFAFLHSRVVVIMPPLFGSQIQCISLLFLQLNTT